MTKSKKRKGYHRILSYAMVMSILLSLFNLNMYAVEENPHLLYSNVPVSGGTTGATIANANTSRNLAVADDGTIYAVYRVSGQGTYVATSRDSGASFEAPVKIDTTSYEPEVAVSSNGSVYVVASSGSLLYLYRSKDQGRTFEKIIAKNALGENLSFSNNSVHMATDGDYLYFTGPSGNKVFYNNTGGDGAFYTTTISSGGYVFSDVHVDKETHDVILLKDNPSVIYHVSQDRGLSFSDAKYTNGNVFYSVGTLSAGQNGKYAFISGQANQILRINVETEDVVDNSRINIGNNDTNQGRSLNADAYGNLVSGYTSGGKVLFKVSNDLGMSFGDEYTVATSSMANSFIDPTNGNILYAYQDINGEIKLNVYSGLTVGYKLELSTASLYYETSGATKEVVIKNIGNTDLTIANLALDLGFSITAKDRERLIGLTLAPGETDSIPIVFDSRFAGTTSGLLKISLAGEVNTRNVILQGKRTDGIIKIQGSKLGEQTVTAYGAFAGATLKLYDAQGVEVDSIISTGSGTDTFVNVAFGTDYTVTQTFEGSESEKSYGVDVLEPQDDEAPEIILIGEANVELTSGQAYNELGAEAFDNVDGYLPVTIKGQVDTTSPGAFTITYSATDTSGNTASTTRHIQVGSSGEDGDLITYGPGDREDYVTQNFDYTTKGAIGIVDWKIQEAYTHETQWEVVLDTTTHPAIYVMTSSTNKKQVNPDNYVTTGAAISYGGDPSTTVGVKVRRPLLDDVILVLKATMNQGKDVTEKTYNLVIKSLLEQDNVLDYAKTLVDVLYQGEDNKDNVTQDLILTQTGPYATNVSWESSNEAYVTDAGKVTQPEAGQERVKVVMTATITKDGATITKSFTLYVQPKESSIKTGDLEGTVTEGETPLAGVEVKVMKNGTFGVQYGGSQVTDANGAFSFKALPYGTYSLVGTKEGKIVTKAIVIKKALTTQNLVMPDGNRVTTVELSEGTPSAATNDLDNMFSQTDKQISQEGGTVTVKLRVDKKQEADVAQDLALIRERLGRKTLGFILDIKLTKSVLGAGEADVTDQEIQPPVGEKVTITLDLPEELWNKAPYQVIHVHEGQALLIDAVYDVDVHTLTFDTNKFSTFSIIYTEPSTNRPNKDKDDEQDEVPWTSTFEDVDEHWAKDYIHALEERGLVEGDQGKYRPDIGITRAEIATLLLRISETDTMDLDDGFNDVDADAWYALAVATARHHQLVKGVSDTEYEPERIVTRQELTTMMIRLYKYMHPEVELQKSNDTFIDHSSIYDYAVSPIYEAKALGLVEGDTKGMFNPLHKATRAEAAAIIYRFLEVTEMTQD